MLNNHLINIISIYFTILYTMIYQNQNTIQSKAKVVYQLKNNKYDVNNQTEDETIWWCYCICNTRVFGPLHSIIVKSIWFSIHITTRITRNIINSNIMCSFFISLVFLLDHHWSWDIKGVMLCRTLKCERTQHERPYMEDQEFDTYLRFMS